MIAGPNGSGKSTLIAALRADPRFELPALYINADDLQRERNLRDSRAAQQLANELRSAAIAHRQDVMYETVMSHPSKIAELRAAKSAGYHITVLLVATDHPNINVERVALRVAAGGHDVPEDRTRSRYIRTLALAPAAIRYADQAFVFDNTLSGETGGGLSQQAGLIGDRLVATSGTTAPWVARLIEQINERA
jgi:predicted ABC-type ATPase